MDEESLRNDGLYQAKDVTVRVIVSLVTLLDSDRVAMTVLRLQVVGRTENDKASVDHDGDLVA